MEFYTILGKIDFFLYEQYKTRETAQAMGKVFRATMKMYRQQDYYYRTRINEEGYAELYIYPGIEKIPRPALVVFTAVNISMLTNGNGKRNHLPENKENLQKYKFNNGFKL